MRETANTGAKANGAGGRGRIAAPGLADEAIGSDHGRRSRIEAKVWVADPDRMH